MQVSTISKHYAFLIKIAPIYASVHYINTLHFSYTKNSHHTFLMQASTISKHYAFLIKIAPIYASVHYITALHFSHNCPPYQITTLLLCKHAKIASICKCPPYQMASFSLHYCPPYQITTLLLCKHAKIASIDKCPPYQMASFFLHYCPPYTFSIQNHHSRACLIFCTTFLMKVYPKSQKSSFSHLLTDFPNESLSKIAKSGLPLSSQPLLQPKSTQNRKIWDMAECPYGPFVFLPNIHGHRTLKAPHPV
ncbi:hypothetical protein EDD22DRAFT_946257 [Suillus occidentalis]|nr:hypothetical protein EDD22DRAFT_946551 [Suillus occidentalis]KAG1717368.1 hypothetical protein EDD22DRAFT_946257 [Suillus occidentalis]